MCFSILRPMKSGCTGPEGYLQTWPSPSCPGPGPRIALGPPAPDTVGPQQGWAPTPHLPAQTWPPPSCAPTCGPSLSPSLSPGPAPCQGWGCHGAPGCLLPVGQWDEPWPPEPALRLPYTMTGCNCASLCVNGTFAGIQI